jgi:hypothetical protein
MNKQQSPIHLKGAIELTISPQDSLLWKLSMILEAAHSPDQTIEQVAGKYGYSREYFYQLKDKLTSQGSQSLADRPSGPKTNYRRTMEVTKQVILHRFLDPEAPCEVIAQKLRQTGYSVSQRSVERIIGDFNLQKKGYIRQIRQSRSNP